MPTIGPSSSVSRSPGKSAITFPVDAVTPAYQAVWTESLTDSLGRRFRRKILALPDRDQPVINAAVDSLLKSNRKFDVSRLQPAPPLDTVSR